MNSNTHAPHEAHYSPGQKGLGTAFLSALKYSSLPYGKIADRVRVGVRRTKKMRGEKKTSVSM